jgi:peroxiredoxin
MLTRRNLFPLALTPLAAALAQDENVKVPRPAGELVIDTTEGKKITLSSYRGKVVAVEFLLTWCEHCQKSAQYLQQLYADLNSKGFVVIGAATNTTPDKARVDLASFVAATKAKFPLGYITDRDKTLEFLQHSEDQPMYFPQIALVDRKGRIQYQHTGTPNPAELRAQVQKLL